MADEEVEEGERDEGPNEREPLLQPTYLRFRQGRQPQNAGGWSVCSGLILLVFKVVFCSLGLWGHQKWNYIPRFLFVIIGIIQAGYQIFSDCSCPYFDCSYYKTHNKTNESFYTKTLISTENMCFTIFSLAALLSYSTFLVSLIAFTSQDSAMMSPSKSMAEVTDRKEITLLFFVFIITVASFLSGIVLIFITRFKGNVDYKYLNYISAITIVLTHWASFNTCHVFAISSFSLGKYLVKHLGVKTYVITFILEENKI